MKSRDESQQEFTVESVGQLSRAGYELVTVKKASEILGYSPRHVRRLANSGQLIAIKISRLWLVVPQLIKSCPPAGVHDTS